MDYLNRLFIIILILYKDSGYEDRLMLTLLSLKFVYFIVFILSQN